MAEVNFKMISLNVRGLNNVNKRKAVLRWLEKSNYDIALLQETHSTQEVEKLWHNDWKGPIFFSNGTSNSKGCCILISNKLDFKPLSVKIDGEGRFLIIQCLIADETIAIVNVYAPNKESERIAFLKQLNESMDNCGLTNLNEIIMGGDWNIVRDIELDKSGGNYSINQHSMDSLEMLMEKFNLNDSWRIKNPNTKRFSWRQSKPLIQCRLDYWLISDSLYDKIIDIDIKPSIRSDHSAITVQFQTLPTAPKGPNFWKFNSSLLTDKDYTDKMKTNLEKWKAEYDMSDIRIKWELIKYEIRKFTIQYAKNKKNVKNQRKRQLETLLRDLERSLSSCDNITKYNEVKHELKQIDDEAINGLIIRSKVQWHEEGERSTKYFLGLEKNRGLKKHVRKLKLIDGTITTDPEHILKTQANYYSSLYSSKLNANSYDLSQCYEHVPTLNEGDRNTCEGVATANECEHVLNTFKNDKSPGNDGITAEFYKHFWGDICDTLVDSYNFSFEKGELSTSQKQAIITLLDKGKDRLRIENWRPISLLNVDYKIISKVIAQRLENMMPKLVGLNQTGFIKGRFINDTVRSIYDLIDYCKQTCTEGVLMMIDFEKAFDSLEWEFLFETLTKMNFGPSFINWIKLFYNNIESCISNNGISSKYFKLHRGVRQGDPLSGYLFILCVEVMSNLILSNKNIKGIKVNDQEFKLLQYADDTTAVLKDEQSVREFLQVIHKFGKSSGLKINASKTEAVWLGNNPDFKLPYKIKWANKLVKVLGVYVGWNTQEAYRLTISKKITSIKHLLYSWMHRKLTLNGRVLILKSLAVSQIIYIANLIPFPDDLIREIEEMFYEFLWCGKTHKVKKSIITQDFSNGGHKMIDVRYMISSQKLKWVKLYLKNHDCLWKTLTEALIKASNLNMLLRGNCDKYDDLTKSMFYLDVLQSLSNLKKLDQNNKKEHLNKQYIFYNKHLTIANRLIYDDEFFKAGLWSVNDLFETGGKVISFNTWECRGVSKSKYMIWRSLLSKVKCLQADKYEHDEIQCNHITLPTGDIIDIEKSTSKEMYNRLIKLKAEQSKAVSRYIDIFPSLDNAEIERMFLLPRICTQDNSLKEFQYKLLNRYLPTNALLFKMDKINSNKCNFCNLYKESIVHLFYDCCIVRNLWFNVEIVLSRIYNEVIELCCKDVILGYKLQSSINSNVKINNIILHVKMYIWQCKTLNLFPSYSRLIEFIGKRKMLEPILETFFCEL
jgi:exonuclease III